MMNNEINLGHFTFPSGALFIMGFRLQRYYCGDYCGDFYGWWILVGPWVNGKIILRMYITELFSHPIDGYSPKARLVYYA